jgi:hypothetical protein
MLLNPSLQRLLCHAFVLLLSGLAVSAFAATVHVAPSGGHVPPFNSWRSAATNIEAAVQAARSGDVVLLAAGEYRLSRIVAVKQPITMRSAEGPSNTIVRGQGSFPCFRLESDDERKRPCLDGLTIADGRQGVMVDGGLVTNCIIRDQAGMGLALVGIASVAADCRIVENEGGASVAGNARLLRCAVTRNRGGGVICSGGVVQNCLIRDNDGRTGGGVLCTAWPPSDAPQSAVQIRQSHGKYAKPNVSRPKPGATEKIPGRIIGCLIVANEGGGVYCQGTVDILNCTIADNRSSRPGAGVLLRDVVGIHDSIVYFNQGPGGANDNCCNAVGLASVTLTHSCTTPSRRGEMERLLHDPSNVLTDPLFVDRTKGDYRLAANSPCVDAGEGTVGLEKTADLDGRPRVAGSGPDMGAYER